MKNNNANINKTEKIVYNMDEVAKVLGICKPRAYDLARLEGFPVVRISQNRMVVPIKALETWLVQQAGCGVS